MPKGHYSACIWLGGVINIIGQLQPLIITAALRNPFFPPLRRRAWAPFWARTKPLDMS